MENEITYREVFFYKDYFLSFFSTLSSDVQKKLIWTLRLITTTNRVPIKFLKYIYGTSGIFEIRVEVGSDIYRVFSFFDKGQIIVIMQGFQKKSQRIPTAEIKMAERIKKQYFDEKTNQ